MTIVRLIIASGLLCGAAGCVSPAEVRARDGGQCQSYGFRPGSTAFAECLQRIDLDRSADRRAFLYDRGFYGGGFGGPFGWRRGW